MNTKRIFPIVVATMLCLSAMTHQAQAQPPVSGSNGPDKPAETASVIDLSTLLAQVRKGKPRGFSLMTESRSNSAGGPVFGIAPLAAAPSLPVTGGGTLGRLTKWTGFTSSNAAIGDSSIYEDKFGKVGIGTDSPTSKLTVAGTIEATGGFKFPDSAHDATIKGDGTTASPLGVAVPLVLSGAVIGDGGSPIAVIQASNSELRPGVIGTSEGASPLPFAIAGVVGRAVGASGVTGESSSGVGVTAFSFSGTGVDTRTNSMDSSKAAIRTTASGSGTGGLAAIFQGNVRIEPWISQAGDLTVSGKLQVTSGMKMFHIDHPLDPENKYLNHAAIESSEVLDVYSGNIITDVGGDAVVQLPDWFEALNKDFRYQLTVVGTFAQAIVADEIKDNRFAIRTNAPNVKVSWQVTGVRSDPTARKYRFEIEEDKAQRERGYYLNPDAYNQPEEKSIQWARDPQGMKQLQQRRIEADQMRKQQPNQP